MKSFMIRVLLIIAFFGLQSHLWATSLVYSMRIRRAFNLRGLSANGARSTTAISAVPIYVQRNRTIAKPEQQINFDEERKIAGSVFNVRYSAPQHWWVEFTTALADEWFRTRGTTNNAASKFKLDDIVIGVGHNIFATDDLQFVWYGIGGVPTSWTLSRDEIQDTFVGTKFFSLGAGSEFSYSLVRNPKSSLILLFQNRLIHFFNRSWQPILQPCGKIQPGNAIDLLFSIMYRFTMNLVEFGYNPTFFNNQGLILPNEKINNEPFVRNAVYARYSHLFKDAFGGRRPLFVGTGFSYSRARFTQASIYSVWGTLGIVF